MFNRLKNYSPTHRKMKTIAITALLILLCGGLSAQDIFERIDRKTKERANRRTDQGIDKGLDKIEDGVTDIFRSDKDKDDKDENSNTGNKTVTENASQTSSDESTGDADKAEEAPALNWSKYDFVPGDKVIFEDNLAGEENGEFPSRWDLVEGNTEVANFGGDNVIMFRGGAPIIVPYLKNPGSDYLPDIFTVEFDLYIPGNSFTVYMYDRKNQRSPSSSSTALNIWSETMEIYPARSKLPNSGSIAKRWAHIAIAYTQGKYKAYVDDTRLINIPHLDYNPTGISLHCYHANDQNRSYVKNFRLAEGGVKYYDRVLQDGKIVANGIRFDMGKATLRPESMGIINEICELMNQHPELNFSVEGHTDSDGNDDLNQKLSEDRAKTVLNTLVNMGISKDRLRSKGFGESKPIDTNSTAEGKANNRRVEFVKI